MVRKAVVASLAALSLSMLVVVPACADDPPADTPDTVGGRYTLNKVAEGFVRLDTKTGEVALCSQRAVGWACQAAPEDRAATAAGYARGFRLSSELVAGVLVGAGLGWLIDRAFGISPWGLIVFLLLGFAAGVLNVMRSAGVVPSPRIDSGPRKDREGR